MRTLVDSSALFALIDEDDANHSRAREWLTAEGADARTLLSTHSYVVTESLALVRNRLGPQATRLLIDALLPALSILYVDRRLHESALASHRAALERRVSFVDWVSFEMMRHHGITRAFAFDADFAAEGFELVPR